MATTSWAFLGNSAVEAAQPSQFLLGIDVLARGGFRELRGKRIGLLTHPAGVNRAGQSTIHVLKQAPEVRLVALFGPEHGIYGDEKANVPVDDKIDARTGLPVFSLYGKFRRPTPEMLARIDTMVIDLQDIGSRSYTYVSCMRYVIEECFKAGKEVIVLDRPNPLGGLKVDGPPLEEKWMSYVGAFQVPYVHGLTIGELANMALKKPGVLKIPDAVRRRGRLKIISMQGWRRSMMWTQTGLKWIPTSPAIPDLSAVLGYPMTGLGAQLGSFSHGYGTHLPFRLIQFTGTPPETISKALTSRGIRGLSFPVIPFEVKGKLRRATYAQVTNWNALRPTELSLHMMALACEWSSQNPFATASSSRQGLFNKHVGDERVLNFLIEKGSALPVRTLLADWENYCRQFAAQSRAYHLY
ncbi:DUF1343 domain-containing protein [Puniceicoccales bacterium CK1056]|uniref:DUF1343 domain-containing protein n=2 Tax=Oceanipulchritudo coccoides TaxID=2706888 RepID=A0A6B2LY08_9BACT|nr:DUF1343 domain-containing protein [Oceanipulchritudo coccoides]